MPQMTATSLRGGVLALLFKLRGRSLSASDSESIHRLVASLGKLKGVAMKMGQHLSYVDSSIPDEVCAALAALQTHSQPMSMTSVAKIVRGELGARAAALLDTMEPVPIASASIGQVHRARLPNGTAVAVKVQHPGVRESIDSDFGSASVATRLAAWVYPSAQIDDYMREARARVIDECDYRSEARHQITLATKLAGHPVLSIPAVHHDYSSDRVLTSELVDGVHLDEFLASDPSEAERSQLGNALLDFYIGSLLRWNILCGDPHPGNYLRCADGRIAIVDHGCTRMLGGADGERRGAIVRVFDAPDRASAYRAIAALGSDSLLLLRIRFGLEAVLGRLGVRSTWRDLFRSCVSGVVRSEPSLAPLFTSEAPAVIPMMFEVVLRDAGSRMIEVVRHVRDATGAGIGDAKQLVDHPPCVLLRTSDRGQARELERRLAGSGATVDINEVPVDS
jgi:predicted unusual protein kinase regulating ubiquinone biosynthesis (AarF/ABC1/UbiB family)/ribosomal protein L7/L12